MTIKTVTKTSFGEYKSMNSRFIGILMPFEDKSKLKSILESLKKEHPKSCHICFAYRIGYQSVEERSSDDGEPSGTAGKPILNQLLSQQLSNAIILVVRYYGGTNLGVSGLISAYKQAANTAIEKADFIEKEETVAIELNVSLEVYFDLISRLKKEGILILSTEITDQNCKLRLEVPVSKVSNYDKY